MRRRWQVTVLLLACMTLLGGCSWLQDEFFFTYHPGDLLPHRVDPPAGAARAMSPPPVHMGRTFLSGGDHGE